MLLVLTAAAGTYTALGTEPFWNLVVDRRALRLERAGEPTVTRRRPVLRIRKGVRRYTAGDMTVQVVRQRCSDGMSDRLFADRVTVRWRGQVLEGCGRPIGASPDP